jgi:hypothetical protein
MFNNEKNSEQVKSEVRHEQAYLSREIHKLGKLEYWQFSITNIAQIF